MSTVHIDRAARSRWLVIMSVPLVALVVFIVTITATVRTTDSDMMGSLLAAESLVQGHWLRLDHYPDLVKTALGLGYRTELVNGHLFYSFPIGTSLLVAPFTPVLALFGLEVTPNDDKIQIGLAALAAVLVFTLLYLIARRFQPHWFSLLLATIFWFGTSFASTGASALWSHNFGSVLTLLGLLLLVDGLQRRQASYILWSGLVAGLAFIVRPQLALLAVGIAILLALRWRKLALPFVVTTAVIVASFSLFTQLTSGVWLPSYYLPQRLEGGSFWVAFAGNMVSPGRGLLVFTPILLIGILVAYNWRSLTRDDRALVLLGFGCMIAHWIAISRFPHWWGGWGFGPRLMMDALPGLFLVTVVLWPKTMVTRVSKATAVTFLALGLISIWFHTVQALYNPYSRIWYVEPNSEEDPSMMWDWSYPQFLASERRHEERLLDRLPKLVSVTPGVEYPPDAAELGLVGWSTGFWSNAISLDPFRLGIPPWWPEEGRRWSEGASERVYFTLDQEQMDNVSGQFDLKLDSYGSQRLNIMLNGQPAHSFITAGSPAQESRVLTTFSVDPNMLRSGLNELQFEFPDRVQVGKVSDFREIAVALHSLRLL